MMMNPVSCTAPRKNSGLLWVHWIIISCTAGLAQTWLLGTVGSSWLHNVLNKTSSSSTYHNSRSITYHHISVFYILSKLCEFVTLFVQKKIHQRLTE